MKSVRGDLPSRYGNGHGRSSPLVPRRIVVAGGWHHRLVGRAGAEREHDGSARHPGARQLRGRRDDRHHARHLRSDCPGRLHPAGTDPKGQTLHGDHAYVFYQVPVNARRVPLIFWHGHGQSAKTWETTPDGREGFQTIFLRRGYPVYLVDQPRRGRAARTTQSVTVPATPDEQLWFGIFRLGVWPSLYPGVQFSRDPAALGPVLPADGSECGTVSTPT